MMTSFYRPFQLALVMGVALVLLGADMGYAQNGLNAQDLSNVRAEQVSDDQLRSYISRAESEGITMEEAFQMARQRGLPASEASALRQRVEQLSREEANGRAPEEEAGQARAESDTQLADRPPRVEQLEERRIFGADIFRDERRGMTPSMSIPTPETYTVGPGDELTVHIWGEATNIHTLTVGREGTIDIENLGPVFVSGLSIGEASDVIIEELQQVYSGLRPGSDGQTTWARVSLSRLRSIQVSVLGEVHNPGDHTVHSLSTLFHALYQAGGPSATGSYRNIRVIRDHETVAAFDLYDFLVDGSQQHNIRLRDQDVIMVEPYEQRVDLSGEVLREALFELKEGETLTDLLRYAGSFTDRAYTERLRIYRNTPTERRIVTVRRSDMDTTPLQGGDEVFVDEILDRFENRVSIQGAVWRDGEYELSDGMTLRDLIEEADGLRPDVFTNRGIIQRVADDYTLQQINFRVDRVMDGEQQITLRPDDQVLIQSIHDLQDEQRVQIRGAVRDGGTVEYREGMTLSDLILQADGFRDSASEARIEISRRIMGEAAPDRRGSHLAETFQFSVNRDLSLDPADEEFELQPFDYVYVFSRPDYATQHTIRIEGEVLYPGTYVIRDRQERVSDLIERAGGLTSEAFVDGARLTRERSTNGRAEVELDFLAPDEQLDADTTDTLNGVQNGNGSDDSVYSRIGLDLAEILRRPGSAEDLMLRDGDLLTVPEQLETVLISGAVMQDVEVRYRDGMSLRDYVDMAGGYTENARKRRAYVVYANGDVDRRRNYVFGLFRSTPDIEPGAEIIIPAKPPRDGMSTGELLSITATIVSMLSTTAIAIDRLSN